MLNLLNQSKLWAATCFLAVVPIFAQQNYVEGRPQKSFEQGRELRQSRLIAGYNAPANIDLYESWDVYITASYLYWQAQQENIEIGLISANMPENDGDTPYITSYVNNTSITQPNFTYRPAFKFGIGAKLGRDGWDAFAEYTWFHGSIGSGVSPLPSNQATTLPPNGRYLYGMQGETSSFFFQTANQSWGLKMDFLDLSLGRSYYSGTRLTIHPFFGARGAWIRQTVDTTYVGSTTYSASRLGYTQSMNHNSSTSWGLGPRAGFDSNWLLGYGVRLIGKGSGDILYTRYITHKNDQISRLDVVDPSANPITENISLSQKIDYLRAHTDLEMGFGWGSYFDNHNWHIDLSATYGFQIFWDQNMFREFVNPIWTPGKSYAPNGNLYVHGLTLNGRLDF